MLMVEFVQELVVHKSILVTVWVNFGMVTVKIWNLMFSETTNTDVSQYACSLVGTSKVFCKNSNSMARTLEASASL